jgi:hypothetical protein
MLGGAPCGGERRPIAAETVVQHRGCVLGQGDRPSLTPFGRVFPASLDQIQRVRFLAPPDGEHERGVSERRVAGCLRDRIRLLDQSRRRRELSGMHVHAGAIGRGEGEHAERAGVAGELQLAGRQLVPRLVLPEIGCDTARQPEPANVVLAVALVSGHGVQRLPQRRNAGCVPVGEASRQTVQEQVDRSRRLRSWRRRPSRLCHF